MDFKKIFRRVSQNLYNDFVNTAEIKHGGVKGTFRESSLKKFLEDGKIPQKYGIGSGIIVSPFTQDQSHESDLVIYDKQNCPILMYSEEKQVFPIEKIYGIIEVKSQLSKNELINGLKKIKQLRQMLPEIYPYLPLGIIFAYQLSNNSLDSLNQNLSEWQKYNLAYCYPNLIVVLNEGIIEQTRQSEIQLKTENFNELTNSHPILYKEDTLLKFYTYLFELLSTTKLYPMNFENYITPYHKVGDYYVRHHLYCIIDDRNFFLSQYFIEKVVKYCTTTKQKTFQEIMILSFGVGRFDEETCSEEQLFQKYYYYNPDDLPGYHEYPNAIQFNEKGKPILTQKLNIQFIEIEINDEWYHIPSTYIEEDRENNLILES